MPGAEQLLSLWRKAQSIANRVFTACQERDYQKREIKGEAHQRDVFDLIKLFFFLGEFSRETKHSRFFRQPVKNIARILAAHCLSTRMRYILKYKHMGYTP